MPLSPARAARLVTWVLKPVLWIAALAPAALLALRAWRRDLGVDPVETLTLVSGETALILLLCSLAVTPLRRVTGIQHLVRLRRPLGLFAFFYACCHFAVYAVLDQGLALDYVWEDIAERPYITVGTLALVLMIPLAVTSTRGWIRRLGRRWSLLHRLVYASAALAVLHFTWAMKADIREPLIYAAILAGLLLARVFFWQRKRGAAPRGAPGATPKGRAGLRGAAAGRRIAPSTQDG